MYAEQLVSVAPKKNKYSASIPPTERCSVCHPDRIESLYKLKKHSASTDRLANQDFLRLGFVEVARRSHCANSIGHPVRRDVLSC